MDVAPNTVSDITLDTKKVRRHVGTTDKKKDNLQLAVIALKNEIIIIFKIERDQAGKKHLKCGCLDDIIKEVKKGTRYLII